MNKKPQTKNIWIFHHYATPPSMTGLTRPYDFAKNLISRRYRCTVFSSSFLHYSGDNVIKDGSRYRMIVEKNVPFVFVKTTAYENRKLLRVKNMVHFFLNLFRVTKEYVSLHGRPDVIIGSSPHPLASIAAIRLANKYGCQSIVEIRDLWPESFVAYNIIKKNNPILKLLYAGEKWIYKKADKIIFTMEGGRDYIREKAWDKEHGGPVDLNKVYHINNGVDLEVFDYNKEHYVLEDEDLKNPDTFKVVYTGSIRLVNKVEKVLDVAKLLMGQNIKFLLWGDGDQLGDLRKRVKDEQIDNVYFKGRADKKYIPYITTQAQLNVMFGENIALFRFGGSMNKMFEYFASGKPTLFTFKTGYSLLERYNTGVELNNSKTETVAKNILYFKNLNEMAYNEYCKNSRRTAEDYSFKNLTSSLIDIIETPGTI